MRVPKAGGGVTTLAADQTLPYGIAVDATNVYYATNNTSSGVAQVKKVPLAGSSTPTVLSGQFAYGLALSGTTLFVGSVDIAAIPTAGGSPTLLVTGQNYPLLAADASNVYWVTTGGVVASVPITGGKMTTLASSQSPATSGIAVDASNVYFTDSSAGTVLSVPITGGGVTTLASGQTNPLSVASAGGYVYWTNRTGLGAVMKVAVGGGTPPTAIATGQINPWGIAVDDTYVYWTTNGMNNANSTGLVLRTTR
jgi:hypothetical protein